MQTFECLPGLLAPVLPDQFHLLNESRAVEQVIARLLDERLETWEHGGRITDEWLDQGDKLRKVARKLAVRTTRREVMWNALFNGDAMH